jgi:hypothetical protein
VDDADPAESSVAGMPNRQGCRRIDLGVPQVRRPTSRETTMRATRFWTTAAATTLVIGALGACSDSPEENSADACASWDTYSAAVDDLVATLTSDAPTVGEVQDARDAVDDAYDDLADAAEDVAQDRAQDVEDAWGELKSGVDDVDDDDTLTEARDSLSAQATGVREAADSLDAELGCS